MPGTNQEKDLENVLAGADRAKNLIQQILTLSRQSQVDPAPIEFDLVITDQTMHGMTGSDLARRMMQIRPDIPIILCTGYSNLIDEESAKTIGIREFTLKPLKKEVIAKLIRKSLKGIV